MLRPYCLVIVRPLDDDEVNSIYAMELTYLEENYESSGYKIFTAEEKRTYIELTPYMKHVKLWTDGGLKDYYVAYVEWCKTYNVADITKILRQPTLNDADSMILPGYFPYYQVDLLNDDIKKIIEERNLDINDNWMVMFHTYDIVDLADLAYSTV